MSSDSKGSGGSNEAINGAKTRKKKKKSPEEYFGSEVDLKLRGLINPAESADLPPASLPLQKASLGPKDATEAEAIKARPISSSVAFSWGLFLTLGAV